MAENSAMDWILINLKFKAFRKELLINYDQVASNKKKTKK
ncbi:hypothetical protein BH18THE2_BH18THE2_16920 [soil metagenome]